MLRRVKKAQIQNMQRCGDFHIKLLKSCMYLRNKLSAFTYGIWKYAVENLELGAYFNCFSHDFFMPELLF